MDYQEMQTLPAYETIRWDGKTMLPVAAGAMKWGKDEAPPAIGDEIVVTINSCGPAIVTGYFVQEGYLGILCTLTNPPEWHVKQNKGNPKGHVFGPEFRRKEA